jgi:HEAT repeat protein
MGGTKRRGSSNPRPVLRYRVAAAHAASIALCVSALTAAAAVSGCRVAESDVKRWETTQRGPFKLVAVLTHDKYSWELRTDAALSLIRMQPRGGVRQGIGYLVDKYKDEEGATREGALNQLPEEARREIVDRMAPQLIKELEGAPPPRTPEGRLPPDPTIPFKDATFAMLVHEPTLVTNEQTRTELKAALTKWAATGFEDRIENGAQQFGLEQMMRYLGPESVKTLPSIINENASRIDRVASLINDVADEPTKLKASEALVALANKYNSKEWLEAQTKVVKESNARNNIKADDTQVAGQVDKIQERNLTEAVFPAMKRVGGRPSIDYLFTYAADAKHPPERRKLALAALEGRVDKNSPSDLDRIFSIAKHEENPDAVRDVAFQRMGEFPKEQIVPKLYTLFEPKKWKTRWVAAETVLKTFSSTKQVPDFLARLPRTPNAKMGMTEPLSYAGKIKELEGDPKPREILIPYLTSKDFGARMTALGYFWEGKKADRGVVQPFETDTTPLPKCEKDDECSWSCDVPKASDPKETEPKELKTVGEFVKFCLVPSMDKEDKK